MRVTRVLAGLLAAVVVGVLAPGVALAGEEPGTRAGTRAQPPAPPDCPSLEGCYGFGDMQLFYDDVIGLVEDYSTDTYAAMPSPDHWYVAAGTLATTACTPATADEFAFFYCAADAGVYVGQTQLWEFYTVQGDGAAAFAVAHEWGHHVQAEAGVFPAAAQQGQRGAVAQENQADCIGGAFLGYLRDRGVLEDDDYDDVNDVLPIIASAESDVNRDHGTLAERVAAVQQGLDGGITSCSSFFPQAPLVV